MLLITIPNPVSAIPRRVVAAASATFVRTMPFRRGRFNWLGTDAVHRLAGVGDK
jgi:hypothetical protein